MNKLIFLIGVFIVFNTYAYPDKKDYVNIVKELCPNADIVDVELKGDYVEIEYWCNGLLVEVGINNNKEVIFTETEVEIPDHVMHKIRQKLDKKYYGWIFDECVHVQLADTSFYKVELLKSGIEENIYFTTDGKFYKAQNMLGNENWDVKSLVNSNYYKNAPFDFLNPHKTFDVPEVLKEISGIAWAGNNTLYCVQDESGVIFKYDIINEEISGMLRFTDAGDFEDIALNGDTAYVLRSDGTLFWFNHVNFTGKYNKAVVPLNCMNIEGLCLDKSNGSFLISCKDKPINSFGLYRSVFQFFPKNKHLPEIAFSINLDEINKMINKHYPKLTREKVLFNPSAIAIHPLTNERYVLSATNRMIAIYKDKTLTNVFPLPAQLYFKPEGLDFAENGDLFLSSEGMKKGYLGGQIFFFKKR